MRLLDIALPFVGLVASAQAWGTGTVYTTIVVPTYTTICPSPTTFAFHNKTYTVTKPTTLTITNCPCTLSIYTPPPVTTTTTYAVPPPPGGFQNSSLTTATLTSTPPPSTELSGTTAITGTTESPNPTNTPVGPTSTPTGTPPVSVNVAGQAATSVIGALLAALAFMVFAL